MNNKEKLVKQAPRFTRSRIYPRYALEQCVSFIRLVDKLGTAKVSQKTVLDEMGKKTSNDPVFSGQVSSSKQFGLLEENKGFYSLTERGRFLLYPTPDLDEKKLLVEAFNTPPLYQELLARFGGKEIPKKPSLGNILFNEFNISKNAKNRAASVFLKSAEYAGVINDNGILQVEHEESAQTTQPDLFVNRIIPSGKNQSLDNPNQTLSIAVSEGTAQISVPRNLTKQDKDKLKLFIENL